MAKGGAYAWESVGHYAHANACAAYQYAALAFPASHGLGHCPAIIRVMYALFIMAAEIAATQSCFRQQALNMLLGRKTSMIASNCYHNLPSFVVYFTY
jgi:hypothetical protein